MSHRTSSPSLVAALLVAGGLAGGLSASVAADQIFGRQRPGAQSEFTQPQARFVAERLYRAVLGREADAPGLAQAARQIRSGNVSSQVEGMLRSPEFRNGTARKSSAEVLEQFYRGLHQRSPDPTGAALFIPRLDRRAYAGVLMEMLESPEFRDTLEREVGGGTAASPAVSIEAAMACQARVLDAVTDTAAGRVLLSFEVMPTIAQHNRVISGVAIDRSEAARTLAYQCDGDRASFNYNDRRPARGADPREPVASPVARNCVSAAGDALREARVVATALIGMDAGVTHVFVTGLGRNGAVTLTCEVNGQRIVSVRGR